MAVGVVDPAVQAEHQRRAVGQVAKRVAEVQLQRVVLRVAGEALDALDVGPPAVHLGDEVQHVAAQVVTSGLRRQALPHHPRLARGRDDAAEALVEPDLATDRVVVGHELEVVEPRDLFQRLEHAHLEQAVVLDQGAGRDPDVLRGVGRRVHPRLEQEADAARTQEVGDVAPRRAVPREEHRTRRRLALDLLHAPDLVGRHFHLALQDAVGPAEAHVVRTGRAAKSEVRARQRACHPAARRADDSSLHVGTGLHVDRHAEARGVEGPSFVVDTAAGALRTARHHRQPMRAGRRRRVADKRHVRGAGHHQLEPTVAVQVHRAQRARRAIRLRVARGVQSTCERLTATHGERACALLRAGK